MRRLIDLFKLRAELVDDNHRLRAQRAILRAQLEHAEDEANEYFAENLKLLGEHHPCEDCHAWKAHAEELTRQLDAVKSDGAVTLADVGYLKEQIRVQRGLAREWYLQAHVRDVYIRDVERLYDTEDVMAEFEA